MDPKEKEEFYRKEVERQTLIILAKKEAQKEAERLEKIKKEEIVSFIKSIPKDYIEGGGKKISKKEIYEIYNNLSSQEKLELKEYNKYDYSEITKYKFLDSISISKSVYEKYRNPDGSISRPQKRNLYGSEPYKFLLHAIQSDHFDTYKGVEGFNLLDKEANSYKISEEIKIKSNEEIRDEKILSLSKNYLMKKKEEYISLGKLQEKSKGSKMYLYNDTNIFQETNLSNKLKNLINSIFNGYYSEIFKGNFADNNYAVIYEIFCSLFNQFFIKELLDSKIEEKYYLSIGFNSGGIDNPCKRYNFYINNFPKKESPIFYQASFRDKYKLGTLI